MKVADARLLTPRSKSYAKPRNDVFADAFIAAGTPL
jgi:hypothetical protein